MELSFLGESLPHPQQTSALLSLSCASVPLFSMALPPFARVSTTCSAHRDRQTMQIRWIVLLSRQGKVRLAKWYTTISQKDRAKILKDVAPLVLSRAPKMCNVIEWKDHKVVYKRYASLYFICGIDNGETWLGDEGHVRMIFVQSA